jgi:Retrotransposon gag protein
MFLIWEGFTNQLRQIFGSLDEELMAEDKLENLQQTASAMIYLTEFQMWATRTSWNKEVLMAKYRRGLKSKVQDALILMEDAEDMTSLIKQAIKIGHKGFKKHKNTTQTLRITRIES